MSPTVSLLESYSIRETIRVVVKMRRSALFSSQPRYFWAGSGSLTRMIRDRIWVPDEWMGDRDLFSQLFFSNDVRRKLEEFTYDE